MTNQILAPRPQFEPFEIKGRSAVPVTLLIGFLGSGKTTLLNRILKGDHGLRVGVLVNDFGAINIDAELIEGVEENMISLSNGCVCCQIRDDLIASLEQLLLKTNTIDYVILEASGVSDPEGIVMTFLDRKFEKLLYIDSITCVIDAEAVFTQGENANLSLLKLRQIGFSDLIILNKVDLVTLKHVEAIKEWIGTHLKRIRIIETVECNVPLEILLSAGRFDSKHLIQQTNEIALNSSDAVHSSVHAGTVFGAWSYESGVPFSLCSLKEMVRKRLPASVYRCKGIVYCVDTPSKRFALQIVGRRTEVRELDEWGNRTPFTKIVAIGLSGKIDSYSLKNLFDDCSVRTGSVTDA